MSLLSEPGGWSQNASGLVIPAATYFFRLTAGMPISLSTCPSYTAFASVRTCAASSSPMPAAFSIATSAWARPKFGDPGGFESGQDLCITAPFPWDQVVPHEFPAFGAPAEFSEHGCCIADELLCTFHGQIQTLCKRLRVLRASSATV